MKPTSLIALAGLALPLLASGAAPADEPAIRAVVDAAILPVMAEHKLPGMAVALTLDGKPYYFNYGVAALESREPVSERTIFELGSISKTFTATLASYAQVQGKLSLDDHPSRFLRQLRGSPIDKATLLELGTYTAGGLPLQFPGSVTKTGVDHYFRHWTPVAPPGTQRLYSNPSIGLLGYAAARALRRDSAEALERLVFPAFGLDSTYVNVPAAAMGRYAWGHDGDKPVRVKPGPLDVEAYGVKSSAVDLLRFVQANIDPSGLPEPMERAVLGTQVPYFQVGPMVQGLGWEQYPYPLELAQWLAGTEMNRDAVGVTRVPPVRTTGTTLFQKTGSTGGFGAYAVFIPQKRIGIVMLANRYYPNAERVKAAQAILSRLAP